MTSRFAVLGSPISHSLSPVLHKAAFGCSGIDASYEALELASGLSEFANSLDASWMGLSLTMPLKEEALDVASQLHPLAISARSANTLVKNEETWLAYNTDVMGLQRAVKDLEFKSVGILGSGATARSAAVAFEDQSVRVWARNTDKAAAISQAYGAVVSSLDAVLNADLVISTVPKGVIQALADGQYDGILLDAVYANSPVEGFSRSVSGLEMLLWQAVGQQRLFRGGALEEPLSTEAEIVAAMRTTLGMGE
jgi:shikimate dehydrogenase